MPAGSDKIEAENKLVTSSCPPKCGQFSRKLEKIIGRGHEREKHPRPGGLEKVDAKTSRGPQHFTGPPRNETDITQNKKIGQWVIAVKAEKDLERNSNDNARHKK
jgi:hypothetical protein